MDGYIRYAEGASVLQSEDQVQHSGLEIAAPAEIRVCRAPVLEGNGRTRLEPTIAGRRVGTLGTLGSHPAALGQPSPSRPARHMRCCRV